MSTCPGSLDPAALEYAKKPRPGIRGRLKAGRVETGKDAALEKHGGIFPGDADVKRREASDWLEEHCVRGDRIGARPV